MPKTSISLGQSFVEVVTTFFDSAVRKVAAAEGTMVVCVVTAGAAPGGAASGGAATGCAAGSGGLVSCGGGLPHFGQAAVMSVISVPHLEHWEGIVLFVCFCFGVDESV
jgi:hypothetical protein